MSAVHSGDALPEIPSAEALVRAARAGSPVAKEALFRRYAAMANGLALRLIGRDADVDDLVQESFLQAFRRLDTLERPEIFGGWLAGIMVRIAHKVLRRRRLLVRLGLRRYDEVDVEALLAPTAPPEVALEAKAVYGAIADLPPKLRIPFLLRRAEGLDLGEIAAMTGASLATVKRRIAAVETLLKEAPMGRRRV